MPFVWKQPSALLRITVAILLFAGGSARGPDAHAQIFPADTDTVRMGLASVVRLVVKTNRTVENAYLDRRADRYDRRVATDKFVPDLRLHSSVNTGNHFTREAPTPRIYQRENALDAGLTATTLLPTGTQLSIGYQGYGDRSVANLPGDVAAIDSLHSPSIGYRQNVHVRVEQPLLQGFGIGVNQASVKIAHLQDASSRLDLESALIGTVTRTILSYRACVQALEQRRIARQSLRRAKQLLERNERLVEAGRMARLDLVQSRTQVSQQQLSLEQARNQLAAARLELLQILDLERQVVILPTDALAIPAVSLSVDSLVHVALRQRPDYHRAQNGVAIADENRLLAKNNKLWDVRLVGTYNRDRQNNRFTLPYRGDPFSVQGGWNVGFSVQRTLGNPQRKQQAVQSRLQANIAENRLRDLRQQIRIAVRGQVREVRQRRRQLQMARELQELSARKLAVEEEKLEAGRSSNFQIVAFQNDLIRARQRELQAVIAYLNALTRLREITGTTLQVWDVEVQEVR